jgi:hypothetical protein
LSLDRSKPVFPIILTYSGISLPNFPYFRKSVLKIDPCPLDCINPQIMDAESFEMLVTFAIKSNITLHDVLSDKLDKPYNIVGDWESYWRTLLKDEDKYLPFHADRFNTFCQSLKAFLS